MLCRDREKLLKTEDILPFLKDIANHRQEHFVVITLDSDKQVINKRIVFISTVNAVIAHPREVFAGALEDRAVSIIVAHNHPSGNPQPSKPDIAMSQQLVAAGQILDVKLCDHIVVAGRKHFSLKDNDMI